MKSRAERVSAKTFPRAGNNSERANCLRTIFLLHALVQKCPRLQSHTQSTLSRCRGNPLQPPSYRHVTVLMTSRASQISRTTESFEKFCLPTINEIFATFLVFQRKCHRQSKSEPWVLGFLPRLFFEANYHNTIDSARKSVAMLKENKT